MGRSSGVSRRAFSLAAVAGAVVLLMQLVLPPVMEHLAAGAVAAWAGGGHYSVRLSSWPAYRMWVGEFDRIQVTARDVLWGELPIRRVSAETFRVRIDLVDLLLNGALAIEDPIELHWFLELDEAGISRYLQTRLPELEDPRVTMMADDMTIEGLVDVDGRGLAVRAVGRLRLAEDEDRLLYELTEFWVDGRRIPDMLVRRTLPELAAGELGVDLEGMPPSLEVTAVRLEEGQVVLEATSMFP